MMAVAAFYRLPLQALPAIHAVEQGHAGVVRHNRNGSDDLGAMQINSIWLPILSRSTGMSRRRLRDALISQDCFNVAVAGAILRIYLNETSDLLTAVGSYHSHTPARRAAYQAQILSSSLLSMSPPHRAGRGSGSPRP